MSRSKAVEWLYWHREREQWADRLNVNPMFGKRYYAMFHVKPPGPETFWHKWVLG